jgi:hypothetical protein
VPALAAEAGDEQRLALVQRAERGDAVRRAPRS